jgi:hypothetical protein
MDNRNEASYDPNDWMEPLVDDYKEKMEKLLKKANNRRDVFNAILEERDYQNKVWPNHDEHNRVGDFLVYIDSYVRSAQDKLTQEAGNQSALDQIRKIAALCVACMENCGIVKRNKN